MSNNSLDRTLAPHFQEINRIPNFVFDRHLIDSEVPLYHITGIQQDVSKIDFVFNAGKGYEPKRGVSHFAAKLMLEGTKKKNKEAFFDALESLGSHIEVNSNKDYFTVSLYTLNQFLEASLELVFELLETPAFHEHSLKQLKVRESQNLGIKKEKTSFLAQHNFDIISFGHAHPYIALFDKGEIEQIDLEDIKSFHLNHISDARPIIFITSKLAYYKLDCILKGKFKDQVIFTQSIPSPEFSSKQRLVNDKKDAMQTSLRYGMATIDRAHADMHQLNITNTILGGYFGSRLMQNIREDKGYTYGIRSLIRHHKSTSYFMVATDCIKEHRDNTVQEIEKEISLLQNELVSDEEIQSVKNYLKGSFLQSLGSPFDLSTRVKMMVLNELNESYYEDYFNAINTITAESIRSIAQKHFVLKEMNVVMVG